MTQNTIRFLTAADVKKALPMSQAIEVMKQAFVLLSDKKAVIPQRIHLGIPEFNGDVLVMPIYLPDMKRIGLKAITLFDDNPKKNLPLIHALITVFDATNGMPIAIMDGSYLTALRTGAGSGVATSLLSREDSQVAAIFGAGEQGRTQLEAICAVRAIKKAIIFDMNKAKAELFAKEMSNYLSIPIDVASSNSELKEVDIISTATNSANPVFSDENLKPGVHINAIGSYKPHKREIPSETIQKAKVIVDHRESCLTEAGDLLIPIKEGIITENHVLGEIGEIISSKKRIRKSGEEITFFKSVGNAIQDLTTANEVIKSAIKFKIGQIIELA
ncbi:MAG: ornithine cyclodeaminase family protein [Candidatus Heimdallarchaeota archaeon]|nr:ornithine cyclodeaminase family protein [Candidatus Heimdallarchaeota archaeon]